MAELVAAPLCGPPQAPPAAQPQRPPSADRNAAASAAPLKHGRSGDRDDERLRSACQDFEALFLGMLFREMQSTVPKSGVLPLGTGGEIYQSLWAQEVGRAAARSSPLGIATMLLDALRGSDGTVEGTTQHVQTPPAPR
ncbi:MAG: rod-binding protein [Armatimonadota bacterium]